MGLQRPPGLAKKEEEPGKEEVAPQEQDQEQHEHEKERKEEDKEEEAGPRIPDAAGGGAAPEPETPGSQAREVGDHDYGELSRDQGGCRELD